METKKFAGGISVKNPAICQRIYENSLSEVLLLYSDYRIISANPKACSLFGMTEEELCSHFMTDMVDYNDPRLINLVEVAERTGKTHGEITLVRKNGSKFTCEINSFTFSDENGEVIIDIVIRELINRRKEEEELSKNFALYQLAIDATNDGIWDMDMRTNRVFLSANAQTWFGYKDTNTLHRDELCDKIIHTDDKPVIQNELKTVTNGHTDIIDIEFRVNTVTSGWKWIRLRGKVVLRDREGKIIRMLGTFADISYRKLIEKELERKQKEFQSYFDNASVGLTVATPDKSWIAVNEKASQILGYRKEELLRLSWVDLVHPDDIQGHIDRYNLALEGKIDKDRFDTRLIRKDGRVINVDLSVECYRNEDGSVHHFLASHIDITEQKNLQRNIAESETFYRTLTNTTPNGVIVTDLAGKITFMTKRAYQIFKIPESENQIGKSIFSLVAPESLADAKANFLEVVDGRRPQRSEEYKCLNYDKCEFWGEVASSLLFDASGNRTGLMTVGRDISDRKKIEEDLVSAKNNAEESDKLKTALLRNISHEIRTPMNAIIGFSSLLGNSGNSTETNMSYIEKIQGSSNQLLSIINDLVDISTIEAKIVKRNISGLNLNKMVLSIYNQFKICTTLKNIGLNITMGLCDESANIKTDQTKLVQIISSLLINAIKFTEQGKINFGYALENLFVKFFVSDTGIGIPFEYHSKIFTPFFQVEHRLEGNVEGTGLGLSICKAYVELLGGTLSVTSEVGKGSSFYFTIPYEPVESSNLIKQTILNSNA